MLIFLERGLLLTWVVSVASLCPRADHSPDQRPGVLSSEVWEPEDGRTRGAQRGMEGRYRASGQFSERNYVGDTIIRHGKQAAVPRRT